jgi:hypothetical protein
VAQRASPNPPQLNPNRAKLDPSRAQPSQAKCGRVAALWSHTLGSPSVHKSISQTSLSVGKRLGLRDWKAHVYQVLRSTPSPPAQCAHGACETAKRKITLMAHPLTKETKHETHVLGHETPLCYARDFIVMPTRRPSGQLLWPGGWTSESLAPSTIKSVPKAWRGRGRQGSRSFPRPGRNPSAQCQAEGLRTKAPKATRSSGDHSSGTIKGYARGSAAGYARSVAHRLEHWTRLYIPQSGRPEVWVPRAAWACQKRKAGGCDARYVTGRGIRARHP